MLNDGNPRCKKDRVYRSRSIAGIVDIQRINSNQGSALVSEVLCSSLSQERMPLKVLVRAPVAIPTSVDQHGATRDVDCRKVRPIDGATLDTGCAHNDPGDMRHVRQWCRGQICPTWIAVVWRIDVCAGIGDHIDATDLELRARGVVRS